MSKYYKILGIGLLSCLMSCSEQEIVDVQSQGNRITATAVSSGSTSVFSRLGFEDKKDGEGGVGITWADGDKFYMKGENGAYATMAIEEGETGKKSALFTGGLQGGTLAENESISAYYPSAAYDAKNNRFNVDLRESVQDCSENKQMNHLSDSYYMIGSGEMKDDAVGVSFVGGTKVAMLRLDLKLPKQTEDNLTINELLIVCDDLKTVGTMAPDGTFTPDEAQEKHRQAITLEHLNASTTAETTFSVYVNVLPVTFTGTMRLKAMLSDETVYWCDVDLKNVKLEANYRYYLVRAFLEAQKVEVDYFWYTANKNATEFEISTESQLRALAKIVNNMAASGVGNDTFEGQTIKLMNGIDLKVDWIPIGYNNGKSSGVFRGTFDGGGHIISGIYCDDGIKPNDFGLNSVNAVGFFGVTMGTTIENLTVQGIVKSNKHFVGGLIGRNIEGGTASSVIKNCRNEIHVSSTNLGSSSEKGYVGGIVGYTWGASIMECSNSGTIQGIDNEGCLGGIAGGFSGQGSKNKIMACYNEGTMIPSSSSTNVRIGGIVASFYDGRNYKVPLIACYNLSECLIEGESNTTNIGGIIGYENSTTDRKLYVYGCYSIYDSLFGNKTDNAVIHEPSCLAFDGSVKADVLNEGITAWNSKADGVNGVTTDAWYCNFKFVDDINRGHLVVVEGAPETPTTSESGQQL